MRKLSRCPSDETIACFLERLLTGSEEAAVRRHVEACAACRAMTGALREVDRRQRLEPLAAVPEWVSERAKRLVHPQRGVTLPDLVVTFAGRAFTSLRTTGEIVRGPAAGPAYALRARRIEPSGTIVVRKAFQRLTVEVVVSRGREALSTITVTIKGPRRGARAGDVRATLERDGAELESHLARQGYATFEEIPPGAYTLRLARANRPIGTLVLELISAAA